MKTQHFSSDAEVHALADARGARLLRRAAPGQRLSRDTDQRGG